MKTKPYFHYFCTLQHKWAPKLAPNFMCYANLEIWPLWGHSGGHTISTIEKPSTNIRFFDYSTSLTITRQQFHRSVLTESGKPIFFPRASLILKIMMSMQSWSSTRKFIDPNMVNQKLLHLWTEEPPDCNEQKFWQIQFILLHEFTKFISVKRCKYKK